MLDIWADYLFKKKQAQAEGLPPTKGALCPALLRAHHQAYIWNCDKTANPVQLDPASYGWEMKNGVWKAVMTTLEPAPTAIIHLVKCACKRNRCSTNQCKCRKNGLSCTDLCGCSEDDEECENTVDSESEPESDTEDDLDSDNEM
jgi:hypothetical protein